MIEDFIMAPEEAIPSPEPHVQMVFDDGGEHLGPATNLGRLWGRATSTRSVGTKNPEYGIDVLATLIEALQQEFDDLVVDVHQTKTKVMALERDGDITQNVVLKKLHEGGNFKRYLKVLTIAMKGISLSGRLVVPCATTRRCGIAASSFLVDIASLKVPKVDQRTRT